MGKTLAEMHKLIGTFEDPETAIYQQITKAELC